MTTDGAAGGQRLKIVYVIGSLDVGGTEGQLVDLAATLDPARFDVTVLCLAEANALPGRDLRAIRLESVGLRGVRPWRQPLTLAARFARFVSLLRRERPDIVHGFLFHGYVLGGLGARALGVPVVVASRRSLGHFKRGKPHYALLERVVNPMTDLLIANSESVREDVIRREGVPLDKVQVIHNGLDLRRFDGLSDRALPQLGSAGPVVVVVANLIRYKGHRYFLDAWATVRRQWPGAVALLVGDGPLRAELEATVRTLGLGASVRFLGTRHDVPAILARADVVVHPSLQEGFSNAILEGMAAARPVVATAVGGNPEAVRHEETGLLVPPADSAALADAMARIFADPVTAKAWGAAGRKRVEARFELLGMVRQYEAVYERLAERGRASGASPA